MDPGFGDNLIPVTKSSLAVFDVGVLEHSIHRPSHGDIFSGDFAVRSLGNLQGVHALQSGVVLVIFGGRFFVSPF